MDTTARPLHPARWDLLRWELCWTPVEMVGVAVGLLLGQVFDYEGAGTFVLLGVLALGSVVRFRHYSKPPSRVGVASET